MTARPGKSATAPKGAIPRYVELIRVSSAGQAARDTPEAQRRALDRMREARPGRLVKRIEVAEGVSGAKDFARRPDLQQLATLAAEHAFDELRVFAIDRLTRHPDLRERSLVFGLLADAGAKVVDVSGQEINPREEVGELHWSMLTWASAQERKRIAARMKSGKERRAAAGRLAQGQPPFARTYDKSTGRWAANERRAADYRQMFALCLAGHSLAQIAAKLNAQGSVSTRGKDWTGANVCKLLRDPAATGRYTTQGHTFQIPAIVDEETFRAADAKLRANNSLSGPKPTVFALLRKLAVCGACGAPMYMQLGGGTPSRIRYYYCSARDPKCLTYHRVEDVDECVTAELRRLFRDREWLARAFATLAPEDQQAAAEREIREAKKLLVEIDKREERLGRLTTKGKLSGKVGDKLLEEIQRDRREAEAALAAGKANLAAADRHASAADDLRATVERVRNALAKSRPDQWRWAIEWLFPKRGDIRIHPDRGIEMNGKLVPVSDGESGLNASGPSGTR